MNDVLKFKEELLSTGIFKRVHSDQYRCKMCPFCDDAKNHMYVIIKMDESTPVMFNCKKCNAKLKSLIIKWPSYFLIRIY